MLLTLLTPIPKNKLLLLQGSVISLLSIAYKDCMRTQVDGYTMVPTLLSDDKIISITTTIFVTNDKVALSIVNRLAELKIPIPGQVSVLGFDKIRIANLCKVPLTTISQSTRQMGKLSTQALPNLSKTKTRMRLFIT